MFFDGKTTKRKQVNFGGRQRRQPTHDKWRKDVKAKENNRITQLKLKKPAILFQSHYRRLLAERKLRKLAFLAQETPPRLSNLSRFLLSFENSHENKAKLPILLEICLNLPEFDLNLVLNSPIKCHNLLQLLSICLKYLRNNRLVSVLRKLGGKAQLLNENHIHFHGLTLIEACSQELCNENIRYDIVYSLLAFASPEKAGNVLFLLLLKSNLSDSGQMFKFFDENPTFLNTVSIKLVETTVEVVTKVVLNTLELISNLSVKPMNLWKLVHSCFELLPTLILSEMNVKPKFRVSVAPLPVYTRLRNRSRGKPLLTVRDGTELSVDIELRPAEMKRFSVLMGFFKSQRFINDCLRSHDGQVNLHFIACLEEIRRKHVTDFSSEFFTVVSTISYAKDGLLRELWETVGKLNSSALKDKCLFFGSACLLLLLRSSDDNAAFSDFPQPLLRQITLSIKSYLYIHLWKPDFAPDLRNCKTLISLFNLLYDKSLRRDLINETEWLFPPHEVKSALRARSSADFDEDDSDFEDKEELLTLEVEDKLKIALIKFPQVISFEVRSNLFFEFLVNEFYSEDQAHYNRGVEVIIRRNHVFEDAFKQLEHRGTSPFQVAFIDRDEIREEGIDGGGLFKEFLTLLMRDIFLNSPNWKATERQEIFPSGDAVASTKLALRQVRFAGVMLGKAVSQGIVLAPRFAPFFFNSLVGKLNKLDDLVAYDEEIYRNLVALKKLPDEDLMALGLCFEWDRADKQRVILKKNGDNITVTPSNKYEYIARVAHFLLNKQFAAQVEAFADGFTSVIPRSWIQIFSSKELHVLLGGSDQGYQVRDLRRHTVYSQGFFSDDLYIQWFWEILEHLTQEEKAKFLSFVTSCPRPPLRGFGSLKPKFCIQEMPQSQNLPTASTCVNLLKLPRYQSKAVLKQKLLYAIEHHQGFQRS